MAGEADTKGREPRRIATACAVVLILAVGSTVFSDLLLGNLAAPIQLQMPGLDAAFARAVTVSAVGMLGGEQPFHPFLTADTGYVWQLERTLVTAIRLRFPRSALANLKGVGVAIGLGDIWFSRDELLARWKQVVQTEPATWVVLESPRRENAGGGLSPRGALVNWPEPAPGEGEWMVVFRRLWWPLLFAVGLLSLALMARLAWSSGRARSWLSILFLGDEDAPSKQSHAALWFLAGLSAWVALMISLEYSYPLLFTRDDNRVMFLPDIVSACRDALQGRAPIFNPCVYLGAPRLDVGNLALTYPPLYACYAFARGFLGNECFTIEVWSWLHLVLGFCATYRLGRLSNLRPALAATAAFSFASSTYLLIIGGSWIGVPPVAFWFPVMLIGLTRIRREGPSWWNIFLTGGAIGFFFHAGNAQFWAYAQLCFVFAVALLTGVGALGRDRLAGYAAATLLGLAIAAPLMIPQLQWVARMQRQGAIGGGILRYLGYLVLPYGAAEALSGPGTWPTVAKQGLYSGSILTSLGLLALACCWASALATRQAKALLGKNLWAGCASFALLLACGPEGFLWGPMCMLPGLSTMTFPIKFVPYLSLLLILAGGTLLERILARVSRPRPVEAAVFAAVVLLTCAHLRTPLEWYSEWNIRVPYESLDGLVGPKNGPATLDTAHRFLPLSPRYSKRPDIVWTMFEALTSYYGLLSMDGYSPFLWGSPENMRVFQRVIDDPIPALQAYGVRWVLEHSEYRPPTATEDPTIPQIGRCSQLDSPGLLARVRQKASVVARFAAVTVWQLPDAAPLAFGSGEPGRGLPFVFEGDGVSVDTSSLRTGGRVVVNVLMRPAMRAYADGRACPAQADDWDRVCVEISAGTRSLRVRYRPDWETGFAAGLLLGLLALGAGWVARRGPATS